MMRGRVKRSRSYLFLFVLFGISMYHVSFVMLSSSFRKSSKVAPKQPPQHLSDLNYDVCIVGAGLSGAVLAERYANVLHKKVVVIEKRSHIGGNCYDYVDEQTGILMNLYGAHLFHTDSEKVWRYVNQWHEEVPWIRWDHEVRAVVDGKLVPVPVNINTVNSLFGLNFRNTSEMTSWLNSIQKKCDGNCANAKEMAESRVGSVLFQKIFASYTKKQWDKDASELEPLVTARIPVRNDFDQRYFSDRFQALPKHGYTKWFERILRSDKITVQLNTDYFALKDLKCGKTFFTGPIDSYFSKEGLPKLEYRSIRFEKTVLRNSGFFQPASVVNYPEPNVPFTRIVEYKHFLWQKSDFTVIVKEFSTDDGEPYYPVPKKTNIALYDKYKELANEAEKKSSIFFVGRLATYKYINMDRAILLALEMFEKIENRTR